MIALNVENNNGRWSKKNELYVKEWGLLVVNNGGSLQWSNVFKLAKLGEQLQRFSRKKRETKLIFISLK